MGVPHERRLAEHLSLRGSKRAALAYPLPCVRAGCIPTRTPHCFRVGGQAHAVARVYPHKRIPTTGGHHQRTGSPRVRITQCHNWSSSAFSPAGTTAPRVCGKAPWGLRSIIYFFISQEAHNFWHATFPAFLCKQEASAVTTVGVCRSSLRPDGLSRHPWPLAAAIKAQDGDCRPPTNLVVAPIPQEPTHSCTLSLCTCTPLSAPLFHTPLPPRPSLHPSPPSHPPTWAA